MNCVITVNAGKKRKSGPLKEFLVDNTVYYTAITKHLKECSVCSVEEVMKEYLNRRVNIAKFNGLTSHGLVHRAIILESLATKKNQALPPGLVNEFIWRNGTESLSRYRFRLNILETYHAFCFGIKFKMKTPINSLSASDMGIFKLAQDVSIENPSIEELEDLLKVADVMLS
jgi:hypothetical protein